MQLPLSSLNNGETGVIIGTAPNSEENPMHRHRARRGWKTHHSITARFFKRLTDLGLTPGTKVTVVKSAPFNGPLEIFVRGSRLAVGRGMASRIFVDVDR